MSNRRTHCPTSISSALVLLSCPAQAGREAMLSTHAEYASPYLRWPQHHTMHWHCTTRRQHAMQAVSDHMQKNAVRPQAARRSPEACGLAAQALCRMYQLAMCATWHIMNGLQQGLAVWVPSHRGNNTALWLCVVWLEVHA